MALTCKQLALAWGIAVTKVTQAREPTFRKMAKVMLMFPAETMADLSDAMKLETHAEQAPPPMTERELYLREDMLRGRVDREEIHPKSGKQKAENI